MSVQTHVRKSARGLLAALGSLVLACAILVLPSAPANASGSTSCTGSGSVRGAVHGSKDKLHKDTWAKAEFTVSGSATCTSTNPNITSVSVSGTTAAEGTCLTATVTFTVTLTFNNGDVWISTGSGVLSKQGDDIVVNVNAATATGPNGRTAAGIAVAVKFKGAGLVCVNDGVVQGGSAEATGSGAAN